MASEFDEDKNFVLVENTAQTVFKYLDHLKDSRPNLGTRWIWELLQNARDVAPLQGVSVEIGLSESRLTLRHTGRPFRNREVAHLIYHGSTKAKEDGDLGRFGSGFLSTHLISPIVRVRGILHDSRRFDFRIDRTGKDVDELRESMDRSWRDFESSVSPGSGTNTLFTTEFEYDFVPGVKGLIAAGLDQLEVCGPLVLAFGHELNDVAVTTSTRSWGLARKETQALNKIFIQVVECRNASSQITRYVAVSKHEKGGAVALLLDGESDARRLALGDGVPRLYIVFPLVSTERIVFPGVINDVRFKPREDRDGIALDDKTEGGKENRPLLEQLASSSNDLLACIAENRWEGAEDLLAFDSNLLPDWSRQDWFLEFLGHRLMFARQSTILKTRSGNWIAPKDAWIPYADSVELAQYLGRLIGCWDGAPNQMAPAERMGKWIQNLRNWIHLLGGDPAKLSETYSVERLAREIALTGSVTALSQKLPEIERAIDWQVDFLNFLHRVDQLKLLETFALLPSQDLNFKKRVDLWSDSQIDEELKDIAEELGYRLRDTLLHTAAATKDTIALLKPKSEEVALNEVILYLRQQCKSDRMPASIVGASAALLSWLCKREGYANQISGFPVATMERDENSCLLLELKKGVEPRSRPLAPLAAWPERFRPFDSLFARRRTLHDAYGNVDLGSEWAGLAMNGYLHTSPLYVARSSMSVFLPDEPLPETAGVKGHLTEADVEVSNIALLDEKDIGLVDIARKSRTRASQLVGLLVELVRGGDARAFEKIEAACQCGQSHNVFRAEWLVPLRERKWVPIGSDGKRQTIATAESLADLLKELPDLVAGLSDESGAQLLVALGISPADFALRVVTDDEQERIAYILSVSDLAQASGGDSDRLRAFTTEVRDHPELIEEIAKRKAQRESVHRNQQIGALVERLFEEEMANQPGLKMARRHVGSDFEAESDYTEGGQEVEVEVSFGAHSTFIELKATKTDHAKMTPRQAENACRLMSRFALCVVAVGADEPTLETVRQNAKFVFGIGERLVPLLVKYQSIIRATSTAREYTGPVGIDMIDGQYRFRVDRDIWGQGLSIKDAVAKIISASV